ncbi:MAG: hypothetical protein HC904_07010 [Blastochloris sp.]|nr:hypothetical protein [Blastochloris sp.]
MFDRLFPILLLALGLASSLPAQISSPADDFNRANQLVAGEKFSEAAVIYDSLIKNRGASPELHYNLGNALARSGSVGPAVLNYERGLRLRPLDAELRANLNKLRQHYSLSPAPVDFISETLLNLSANTWAALLLLSAWLLCLLILLRLFMIKKNLRPLPLHLQRRRAAASSGPDPCLPWHLGPGPHPQPRRRPSTRYSPLPFPLPRRAAKASLRAGEVIQTQETHADFTHVLHHDGKSGWLRTRDLALITPN